MVEEIIQPQQGTSIALFFLFKPCNSGTHSFTLQELKVSELIMVPTSIPGALYLFVEQQS